MKTLPFAAATLFFALTVSPFAAEYMDDEGGADIVRSMEEARDREAPVSARDRYMAEHYPPDQDAMMYRTRSSAVPDNVAVWELKDRIPALKNSSDLGDPWEE